MESGAAVLLAVRRKIKRAMWKVFLKTPEDRSYKIYYTASVAIALACKECGMEIREIYVPSDGFDVSEPNFKHGSIDSDHRTLTPCLRKQMVVPTRIKFAG